MPDPPWTDPLDLDDFLLPEETDLDAVPPGPAKILPLTISK